MWVSGPNGSGKHAVKMMGAWRSPTACLITSRQPTSLLPQALIIRPDAIDDTGLRSAPLDILQEISPSMRASDRRGGRERACGDASRYSASRRIPAPEGIHHDPRSRRSAGPRLTAASGRPARPFGRVSVADRAANLLLGRPVCFCSTSRKITSNLEAANGRGIPFGYPHAR